MMEFIEEMHSIVKNVKKYTASFTARFSFCAFINLHLPLIYVNVYKNL